MLVVLVATLSLVVFNCEPLTASVLVSVSSPAVTLVILLVASVPCLAVNTPAASSHFSASSPRLFTVSVRLVILVVLLATSPVRLVILVVLVATLSLVVFNCEPLTASLLVAEISPSLILVILLVASEPCAALYAFLTESHCNVLLSRPSNASPTLPKTPLFS